MSITDLPIGIMTNVASFLPKPSRALFAVSLTAPSSSWQDTSEEKQLSETRKAIMSPSSQWKILDFVEDEESLAEKLTDVDLCAVLACIKQTIKILKLTGCINIAGRGLAPLQGSTTLELIDLSLLDQQEDPSTRLESIMSHDTVIPILDRIISTPGSSLKYIHFPYEWTRIRNTRLESFKERYVEYLNRLDCSCSKCNIVIRGRVSYPLDDIHFCCYSCLRPFCRMCEGRIACVVCSKFYCSSCSPNKESCDSCRNVLCGGCIYMEMGYVERCDDCGKKCCEDCTWYRLDEPLCQDCYY